jgi:hypothetical protein
MRNNHKRCKTDIEVVARTHDDGRYTGGLVLLMKTSKTKNTIVLGVIGADCHSVGNKILEKFFTDKGFKVVNLGVMVSQDEFIDAAIETNAAQYLSRHFTDTERSTAWGSASVASNAD